MHRAAVEKLLLVGAIVFIACTGGTDRGTIAGPGPAPTEPGEGVERGDNPFDFQSNGTGVPETTTVTSSSSTGQCATCVDLLDGTVATEACPESEQAIFDLVSCACAGVCETDCNENFCAAQGLDSNCASCAASECQSEFVECQDN